MSRLDRVKAQLERVRDVLPGGFGSVSFAQEGEDVILARIFEAQPRGVYVDVGAHHPRRFSNTELLYRRGWHGLNIDAAPGSMEAFRKLRPRDINLEVGIADVDEIRDFYVFDEPALNTFDAARAKSLDKPPYKIRAVQRVRCAPLRAILHEHGIAAVDLLTIDAEGFDDLVLRTLDWDVVRPRVVLVEQHQLDLAALLASEICVFMRERGYDVVAKTFNSVFYRC
jgi:FkbM family methyltransferase